MQCSIDGRAHREARGGLHDDKNACSHSCSTRDPLVNRGSPQSSKFPMRKVPRSWESPRDIPKHAGGQNPTLVGEGVLPHLLNNFPPHLVFYINSFTISIRTVALDSQPRQLDLLICSFMNLTFLPRGLPASSVV